MRCNHFRVFTTSHSLWDGVYSHKADTTLISSVLQCHAPSFFVFTHICCLSKNCCLISPAAFLLNPLSYKARAEVAGGTDLQMDGRTYKLIDPPGGEGTTVHVHPLGPSGLVTPSCLGKFLLFISPGQKMSISVLPSGLHNHSNILMEFSSEKTMVLLSKQLKVHQSNSFWNPLGRQKFPDVCFGLHPHASAERNEK